MLPSSKLASFTKYASSVICIAYSIREEEEEEEEEEGHEIGEEEEEGHEIGGEEEERGNDDKDDDDGFTKFLPLVYKREETSKAQPTLLIHDVSIFQL
jgi:hypothetical protein